MPRNNYTTEVRILLCESCGAPLEVGADGGVVACSYCRVQNHVLRRNPDGFAIPAPSPPVDENERLRRLRMQDGKPMVPPASLQSLMGPAGLAEAKVNEAFHVFQATRKEVVATHSPEAAERLYFLSLMLNTHLTMAKDEARRRALLETTLETVFLPRHIQVIRCLLATASAKERDLSSADKWLKPCDPRSDDLEADSSYRIAYAFVETVRGDLSKVLHMLGARDDAYPFADAWDPTSAVLRANALERMGQLDAAVQALRDRMSREGFAGRATMEKIVNAHPEMALCPQSFQLAHQGHVQVAAKKAESSGGGMIGAIFYWVGMALTIGGILLGIGIAVVIVGAAWFADESIEEALAVGAFAGGITMVSMLPIGIPFAFIGRMFRNKAKQAAWLRVNGISAHGTIRGHTATGTRINGVPVVRVEVEVMHPSQAPYTASFDQLLSSELSAQLTPGNQVALRVHPQHPRQIMLELT